MEGILVCNTAPFSENTGYRAYTQLRQGSRGVRSHIDVCRQSPWQNTNCPYSDLHCDRVRQYGSSMAMGDRHGGNIIPDVAVNFIFETLNIQSVKLDSGKKQKSHGFPWLFLIKKLCPISQVPLSSFYPCSPDPQKEFQLSRGFQAHLR